MVEWVAAVWEQRNLGVTCTELTIDPGDSLEDVVENLDRLESEYQVVKAPVARFDVAEALRVAGFSFIEASISVEHPLKLPAVTPVLGRVAAATERRPVNPAELSRVTDRVHAGLFDTDRVFIDPAFSDNLAAARYVNWIEDELGVGADLFETVYRDAPNGFFLFRERADGTCTSVLSGLYDGIATPGMGLVLLYTILAEGAERGMRRLVSRISANNLAVVKTHAILGFMVTDVHYVFVRHESKGHDN